MIGKGATPSFFAIANDNYTLTGLYAHNPSSSSKPSALQIIYRKDKRSKKPCHRIYSKHGSYMMVSRNNKEYPKYPKSTDACGCD